MLIMARDKQHRKNDANTGTVPQELVKDKSTLKSVAHNGGGRTWRWRSLHTSLARISAAAEEGGGADVVVIFVNVSMGRHFPRSLGYMSRLGMGFIPIGSGGSAAVIDRRLCPKSTGERN
jgi:hypothetical protein